MVEEIAHIHFTCLVRLDLDGNMIESIEGLYRVQIPRICSLNLRKNSDKTDGNNLTSVGVMRKSDWPALKFLSLVSSQ